MLDVACLCVYARRQGCSSFDLMSHSKAYIKGLLFLLYLFFLTSGMDPHVYGAGYFHVERPKLELGLSYEFEEETIEGEDLYFKGSAHEFKEEARIETKGWAYHPKLLTYQVRFEPQWRQETQERSATRVRGVLEQGSGQGYLHRYSVDFNILKDKPYTLRLYARRSASYLDSAFAEKSETKTDSSGGDLDLRYGRLRTNLGFTHSSMDQTGFYREQKTGDTLRLTMGHSMEHSDTRIKGAFSDVTRTTGRAASAYEHTSRVKNANALVRNEYDIFGDGHAGLNSHLSYMRSDTNNLVFSRIRIDERLSWKHRKNLRSNTRITCVLSERDGYERRFAGLDAALTHTLYENLTTTVAGDADRTDFEESGEWRYGGKFTSNYRRKIPWGTFWTGLHYDYHLTQRDEPGQYWRTADEFIRLRTTELTFLGNENVDVDSIRVMDVTGAVVYIKDVDYRLVEQGASVRISRTALGSGIADGQEVLVTYNYLAPYDDATLGQRYKIGVNLWSVLNLRYGYRRTKQSILSGVYPETPVYEETNEAEMRLDWRWTSTRLYYEKADRSSGNSATTWLVAQGLAFRPFDELAMRLSGHYQEMLFEETDERKETGGLRAGMDWLPEAWLRFEVEGYLDAVSGDWEDTIDYGIRFRFEASYRVWKAVLEYRFLDETDELNDYWRRNHYVCVEIIRSLW